jgi:hypothetical protein
MTTIRRKLQPVPFTQIQFTDGFWAPRIQVNREVTLQHIRQKLEQTGRIAAFDLNFSRPVPSPIVLIFGDSDPAKWLEAASYSLATHPDPALAAQVDAVADKVIAAQQPDGYLNTHFIVTQPDLRWKNLRDLHELYCAGHLIEAAVAHADATGDPKLLQALSRYADLIDETFGAEPGKKRGYCGHPEIELALMRLYHATGNARYMELVRFFLEERGQITPEHPHYYDLEARARGEDPRNFWAKNYEYCQAHQPIREQSKVVGHAVRAMYLFSGVADLADVTQDAALLDSCERLWDNLIYRRMYLTGGIGPSRHNEGFTDDYDLPDETAYAETCATIGLVLWNHRLLQFDGSRKFADVMERGLYNGFLSGVSLDGTKFLYENPLSSAGNRHRQEWFECPCCPPNVARILASAGNYFYSLAPHDLWVHLFAGNTVEVELAGQAVRLRQETQYPWDGEVRFSLELAQPAAFNLRLRLPGWCDQFGLAVNGAALSVTPDENGYLQISREWKNGDEVTYRMEMPIRPVWANPAVRQLQGRVALQRGPLVYCLEGIDHGGIILDRIALDPGSIADGFHAEYRADLLGGVVALRGKGRLTEDAGWGEDLYHSQPPVSREIDILALPYCVWDNREPGEMRVWLRTA